MSEWYEEPVATAANAIEWGVEAAHKAIEKGHPSPHLSSEQYREFKGAFEWPQHLVSSTERDEFFELARNAYEACLKVFGRALV